jgi:hypothetical protein
MAQGAARKLATRSFAARPGASAMVSRRQAEGWDDTRCKQLGIHRPGGSRRVARAPMARARRSRGAATASPVAGSRTEPNALLTSAASERVFERGLAHDD